MDKSINVSDLAQDLIKQTRVQIKNDLEPLIQKLEDSEKEGKNVYAHAIALFHKNAIERSQQFTIELLQAVIDKMVVKD